MYKKCSDCDLSWEGVKKKLSELNWIGNRKGGDLEKNRKRGGVNEDLETLSLEAHEWKMKNSIVQYQ